MPGPCCRTRGGRTYPPHGLRGACSTSAARGCSRSHGRHLGKGLGWCWVRKRGSTTMDAGPSSYPAEKLGGLRLGGSPALSVRQPRQGTHAVPRAPQERPTGQGLTSETQVGLQRPVGGVLQPSSAPPLSPAPRFLGGFTRLWMSFRCRSAQSSHSPSLPTPHSLPLPELPLSPAELWYSARMMRTGKCGGSQKG